MQRAARGEDWRDGPRDVWRPRRPLSSHAAAVHESRLSLRLPYHSSGPPTRIARSSRRDSREARTSAEPKGLKGGSEPVRASLQPSRREALAKLREALAKLSVAARLLIVAEFRNPAMGRGCLEAPVWLPRGPGMAASRPRHGDRCLEVRLPRRGSRVWGGQARRRGGCARHDLPVPARLRQQVHASSFAPGPR